MNEQSIPTFYNDILMSYVEQDIKPVISISRGSGKTTIQKILLELNKEKKMEEEIFINKIKLNDEVFGLIFGKGIVSYMDINSYWPIEVTYNTSEGTFTVPYSEEGIPAWGGGKFDKRTVYTPEEINLMDYDISVADETTLTQKKIIKLKYKNKLEIKCPSGIWKNAKNCPSWVMEEYLQNNHLHLFRKASKEN